MSEFKYGYQQLMSEKGLTIDQLPEDARIGISAIENIEKSIHMAEKKGKKINPTTMKKIAANDKWIIREILDHVEQTDTNDDEPPHDPDDLEEEVEGQTEGADGDKGGKDDKDAKDGDDLPDGGDKDEEEEEEEEEEDPEPVLTPEEEEAKKQKLAALGVSLDIEMAEIFATGKTEFKTADLRKYKNTYNTLFENYEDGGTNGIETSNFKLIETEQETFTLSKK